MILSESPPLKVKYSLYLERKVITFIKNKLSITLIH